MATHTTTVLVCDNCDLEVVNPKHSDYDGWYFLQRKPKQAHNNSKGASFQLCSAGCLVAWAGNEVADGR